MFTKIVEKLAEVTLPILEHGWIAIIPLGIIYFICPEILDNFIVRLLIFIPTGLILLTYTLSIALVVGELVFKKYADEYDRLVKGGENRAKTFVKTSLKAIIIFIFLFLILHLALLKNIFFEPNIV